MKILFLWFKTVNKILYDHEYIQYMHSECQILCLKFWGEQRTMAKDLSTMFIVRTSEAIRSYMSYNIWQGVSTI